MASLFGDKRKRTVRHMKRIRELEATFAKVPHKHRCREVFLILAEVIGVPPEKAHEHFAALLSLLPGSD